MKNKQNSKSQVKNKKVIHRGANFAPPPSEFFCTPKLNKDFLKKMRALCVRIRARGSRIVRESGRLSRAIRKSFFDCAGLKQRNGLLTASRTLTAERLGKN